MPRHKKTAVILVLVLSCALFLSLAYAQGSAKNHPDNWMMTHGPEYFGKKEECKACHGDTLDGGGVGIACNTCHISPAHPKNWGSVHGSQYRKDQSSCVNCHGRDLAGGKSGRSCSQCHLSPRHAQNWKALHGAEFYKNQSACATCHRASSTSKPKSGCNRCHVSPLHPQNWTEIHGAEFLKNNNACTTCHGSDLSGGSAKMSCQTCHLSPKHPENWGADHGAVAMKDGLNQCTTCHGEKLDGGKTQVGCGTCHINPKHPDNWLDEHGTEYLSKKEPCKTCHGASAFGLSSEKATSKCLSCHTGILDTSKWQQESNTNTFNATISNATQIRSEQNGDREYETENKIGFNVVEQNKDISFTSQFRYSREWNSGEYNIDLYETNVQFGSLFNDHASLNLGRQSLISNVDYVLMDGLALTLVPSRAFDVELFAGIPRYFEEGDFDGEVGLVSGLSFVLNQVAYTDARIDVLYQKKNFTDNEPNNTDKIYLSGSASKGFSIFRLYTLGEYDLTDTLPTTITLGTEIYPFVKKVGFLIEGNYFDESRNDNLETVFSILSADSLWQIKSGVFVNAIKHLNLYQNFSLQRFDVLAGQSEDGYNAETGLSYDFEKINLSTNVGYYFIDSYGGTLHGIHASLYESWTQNFFSVLSADYVAYTKITNDDDVGLSLRAKTGVNLNNGLSLATAVEYNQNNAFEYDVRGTFLLNYYFSKRFSDWGQKKGTNP